MGAISASAPEGWAPAGDETWPTQQPPRLPGGGSGYTPWCWFSLHPLESRDAPCPPRPRGDGSVLGYRWWKAGVAFAVFVVVPLCKACMRQNKIFKKKIIIKNKSPLWIILSFLHLLCILMSLSRLSGQLPGEVPWRGKGANAPREGLWRLQLLNCQSLLQKISKVYRKDRFFTQKRCIAWIIAMELFPC